jgi:hypothetical protein
MTGIEYENAINYISSAVNASNIDVVQDVWDAIQDVLAWNENIVHDIAGVEND